MAQALMGDPPVILLAEPTAGLDPKIAASVRGLIRELKRKHTVVVSSHNMQELQELCDATAILDRGRLVSAASASRGREDDAAAVAAEARRLDASLYSLIATCEANDINPVEYLADVLIRVQSHPATLLDELLPHRWKPPAAEPSA